ncbi:septum formation family protein [Nocardioides sp.]|uniref:septum formation family protein n=1 Tax=Nocardioides sp. TaxID=35761 RepID=UPI002CEF19C2|nr:septum formation family protein [Nocardioides sp.]HXH79826.1 septum formation family protein [Nocardioides sp.]
MSGFQWAPAPAQQQPQEQEQSSSAMAVAALFLSLVFCLPILPLVAIVLAIVVLVSGRGGRGMAVAALVLAPLALIPSVLLLTSDAFDNAADEFREGFNSGLRGPEATRDASGEISARSQVGVDNLEIGDCVLRMQMLEDLPPGEQPLGEVTAIPCDEQHKSEVFHFYDLDPTGFENQKALDRQAVKGCLPAFQEYVGVPHRRSTLEIIFYSPVVDQPGFAPDRVTCLASTPAGLTDTMLAGSKR